MSTDPKLSEELAHGDVRTLSALKINVSTDQLVIPPPTEHVPLEPAPDHGAEQRAQEHVEKTIEHAERLAEHVELTTEQAIEAEEARILAAEEFEQQLEDNYYEDPEKQYKGFFGELRHPQSLARQIQTEQQVIAKKKEEDEEAWEGEDDSGLALENDGEYVPSMLDNLVSAVADAIKRIERRLLGKGKQKGKGKNAADIKSPTRGQAKNLSGKNQDPTLQARRMRRGDEDDEEREEDDDEKNAATLRAMSARAGARKRKKRRVGVPKFL